MPFGVTSNVAPLREVAVKSPRAAWQTPARVAAEWRALNYTGLPDLEKAIAQHDALVALLQASGCEVRELPAHAGTGLDSVYVHDPVVMAGRGAVLCRMGKAARRDEPAASEAWLREVGVPILGGIEPPGLLEGGDLVWLDQRTVLVGEGYRSNAEGIRQLRALLGADVDEVIAVPLPHWTGPADCLHLQSILSPVAERTAVVYSRLLPVPFRNRLLDLGWGLIEIPEAEYPLMACNILAVAPGDCIMLDDCPGTQTALETVGIRVRTFPGDELCIKGGGGPTCLTRPLWRAGRAERRRGGEAERSP